MKEKNFDWGMAIIEGLESRRMLASAPVAGGPTSISIQPTSAKPANSPTVTTPVFFREDGTFAILGATVSADGGSAITERGLLIAKTNDNSNPQLNGVGVTKLAATGTTGDFTVEDHSLTPNTNYSFVAFATNNIGTTYTRVTTFLSLPGAPSVTTLTAANVTGTTVTLGGNVTDDNAAPITARGVVYALTSVNPYPEVGALGVTKVPATGTTGVFTVDISNLTVGTSYTFVAYAQNRIGIIYALPDVTFTTEGNHPPTGAPNTVTTLEDHAYTFKSSDFQFSDPNDNPSNSLATVKISSLPLTGRLSLNGLAVTAGLSMSTSVIDAGQLKFIPAANGHGTTYSSFWFQDRDNGGTSGGGVDTDLIPRKMTVAVTSVNDAPTGTPGTVTTRQDTAYTVKITDFGFNDSDDSPSNSLSSVKFTLLSAAGTLADNGVALTVNQLVSVADINAGNLVFTPNANRSGNALLLCNFQVQDDGGTANGGWDTDPNSKFLDVNIVHVNHAPSGTSNTVMTLEDTAYTLKTADFGFTDSSETHPIR